MKTTITIIALIASIFSSNTSNAQKRTSNTRTASPAPVYHSNASSNGAGWSMGGELMLNKTIYSYNGQGYGTVSPGLFAVATYESNRELGFTFKLGYDNKQAGIDLNGASLEASIDYLNIASLVRYSITPEFFVAGGPVLNVSMGQAKATLRANGATQSGMADPGVSTRFGLSLESGYVIPVSHGVSIAPIAGYDYFFSAVTSDGNGRLNNLHLAARVQFHVN
jgi:hypothetical protein